MRFWLIYFAVLAVILIGYFTGIPEDMCIFAAGFITALGALKVLRDCDPWIYSES